MKDYDGMTSFRKEQLSKVRNRSKVWPNLCVGKHCCHTSEQAIVFLLEILKKTVINMFIIFFADGKLMMAWLYINKVKLFACSDMTDL